jgi:hypothetical protein
VERKEKATTETDTAGAWMEGRLNKLKIFWLLAFTWAISEVSIPSPVERYPNVQQGIAPKKQAACPAKVKKMSQVITTRSREDKGPWS